MIEVDQRVEARSKEPTKKAENILLTFLPGDIERFGSSRNSEM